jgi:prevent-host-death family protein
MKDKVKSWPLSEAKNKLTELVNLARDCGPQIITRRSDAFVIIEKRHFDRITGETPSLVEHLLAMPKFDEPVEFPRSDGQGREVEF